MSATLNITEARTRGACPTLDAPMQTGDGLLARLRLVGNRLSPAQMVQLAGLAQEHGNGLIEVTARGNLQVRGLSNESAPQFASAVRELVEIETGPVIDISPLAGEDPHEKADPRPLSLAIAKGAAVFAQELGPKVSTVIDGDGQISLASLEADIRLLAVSKDRWHISIEGREPVEGNAQDAITLALSVLAALAKLGPSARATDLYPRTATPLRAPAAPPRAEAYAIDGGRTTAIALPFGSVDAATLSALANAADKAHVEILRLAPGHRLLLDNATDALVSYAQSIGFIVGSDDARLRISACIGSDGCASGYIAARRLAENLSPLAPPQKHIHVSGCAKGCAHPRPTDLTLVGRADGIGLVFDGRAGDTPSQTLDEAGLKAALGGALGSR